MSGITLTFPIVAGKVEAWRRFCQEMSSAAVTTLEADDVGLALRQIITSNLPFDRWYREQMQELHGVNLDGYEVFSQQAPPEDQELLFEWASPSSVGE
jgi:hypothetical protein